jgi:hypothetical protein
MNDFQSVISVTFIETSLQIADRFPQVDEAGSRLYLPMMYFNLVSRGLFMTPRKQRNLQKEDPARTLIYFFVIANLSGASRFVRFEKNFILELTLPVTLSLN